MNTQIAKMLIDKFDLTPDEHEYVLGLDKEAYIQERVYRTNEILTQLYIIKMNERSAEASDRSTKTMTRLTWVLAIAAIIQAVMTGIQAYITFSS
jgi:hypothetical protein